MPRSIGKDDILANRDRFVLIDARKPAARLASGRTIAGAVVRHPFDALNWHRPLTGREVVCFCVHGHEVSQAVAGFLHDHGVEAWYLEGGFEGWREAGLPVTETGDGDA